MPMGIVSDKEFDSELTRVNGVVKEREESNSVPINSDDSIIKGEIVDVSKGRGNGDIEVPNGLRNIIGETSIANGRPEALKLASMFGISPSSTSAYTQGAMSTASYDERPNENIITRAKDKISKRARSKLMRALHHITDEKLDGAKARDLAGIAKDMSAVIRNMEPEGSKPIGNSGPTFVFYSPQFRKEENFEVVFAKE